MSIKLMSLNIEGGKHLDKVRALIEQQKPDVVCLAECFPDTTKYLANDEYPYVIHTPTYMVDQDAEYVLISSKKRSWGEAILSKYPLSDTRINYLSMDEYNLDNLPTHGTDNHIPALIQVSVQKGNEIFRIGTIHLTWTPKATMTKRQKLNVAELVDLLGEQEIVLAGDFNVPRGNVVYKKLLTKFRDNVPVQIVTTLDPELHYRNRGQREKLELVVDYVFSTPKYEVSDVRVVSGVSDHCALLCVVDRPARTVSLRGQSLQEGDLF